jgi:alkylation response protein AidB-like acyl-CoA dehydrogenase
MSNTLISSAALTALSEEEVLFRDTVREFAETEVRPHVAEMDDAGNSAPT